ncbi:MAG TPA: hypothetical protein VF647_07615 [Longimicrobium sp.]|jgi:hypothetical protein
MHDELIRQIEEATDDAYQVVGQLGADEARPCFLARERETGTLAALSLTGDELRILSRLDAAVPAGGSSCAGCHAPLDVWTDACPSCGARIAGDDFPDTSEARTVLLAEVRSASEGEYDVLGAMDGAAGTVYFARELDGGRLVALALHAEDEEDDACSLTPTWLAPSTAAPTPRAAHISAEPAAGLPAAAPALPLPDPAPRPNWLKRLLVIAGIVAILLIVLAYVKSAPSNTEPAETPAPSAATP